MTMQKNIRMGAVLGMCLIICLIILLFMLLDSDLAEAQDTKQVQGTMAVSVSLNWDKARDASELPLKGAKYRISICASEEMDVMDEEKEVWCLGEKIHHFETEIDATSISLNFRVKSDAPGLYATIQPVKGKIIGPFSDPVWIPITGGLSGWKKAKIQQFYSTVVEPQN